MHPESDLLPLSGLQHLLFCERQWGLIHIEQAWEENRYTAEGRQLHERVHEAETEVRPGVRIVRGLRLRSLRLGLSGQADVVEFHRAEDGTAPAHAAVLPGARGRWTPFPVEYKRGKPKPNRCDEVQLCAQALCLEEMLDVAVPAGALFYGKTRRRKDVPFDHELRGITESLAARMHELYRAGRTPSAVYDKRCDNCSLLGLCLPRSAACGKSARRYLARTIAAPATDEDGP